MRKLHPFVIYPLLAVHALSFSYPAVPASVTNNNIYDVCICGTGPGGLLLASAISKQDPTLRVCAVDPTFDKPWPNNYGVWIDEAECFGYDDCLDRTWNEVGIVFDEKTEELCLNRPYGRIDREKLKSRLVQECEENGVVFNTSKAIRVEHFPDQPSRVTLSQKGSNGTTSTVDTLLVVDATGFSRSFVKHESEFDPGYQVTYGARFKVEDLGPYQKDRMILMDYGEAHLQKDPEMVKLNDRFPSFVYVMPLEDDEIFMEETVLVSRPAASSRDLEARLYKRLEALNIKPKAILEDERAAIPMGGMDPIVPQRTLGFGATSSLVHPASGYMVARAMEIAPRVARTVVPRLQTLRERLDRPADNSLINFEEELDGIAEAGWSAIWPKDERRQRDFMHFGFELLCKLSPQELRDFFTGFFRLQDGLWEHFLSWRLSGLGHIIMGLKVWATCIPKRFMPPMLLKSIPFIGNRLIFPFISRGDLSDVGKTSVYWDAPSDGKSSSKWEPDEYYSYLEKIKVSTEESKTGKEEETVTLQ